MEMDIAPLKGYKDGVPGVLDLTLIGLGGTLLPRLVFVST